MVKFYYKIEVMANEKLDAYAIMKRIEEMFPSVKMVEKLDN